MREGRAVAMQRAGPLWHKGGRVEGATGLAEVKGCDVVVMAAGFPRKPGMSRSDLLKANADIVRPGAEAVKAHAPNATVVVVTNPLDVMTWLFWKMSGLPKQRVLGMAGILDSARFRAFLAMELGVSGADVDAMVLGGHGDSMVPVTKYTTVSGIPVAELIPAIAAGIMQHREAAPRTAWKIGHLRARDVMVDIVGRSPPPKRPVPYWCC